MNALKCVLVGVDFSEPSDNALREAARIAAWDGADLVALNVLDERILDRARREIELDMDDVLSEAASRLDRHVEDILGPGKELVRCEFVVGHPFKELAATADRCGAELIVLGAHGIIRDEPYRLGTLATRCVRKMKQNVLIVRDWQEGPFEKICACVDFSEPSRDAAAIAVHIAQQDEAALDLLHIHQPVGGLLAEPGFAVGGVPIYSPEHDEAVVANLGESLAKFGGKMAGSLPHETHVFTQMSLRGGIVEYLKKSNPDLVVLSTRGHTKIRNLLIGSAAEKIIHEADCSTLVVKPDGFHYELN